jgi:translation elongation factor EF-Ts
MMGKKVTEIVGTSKGSNLLRQKGLAATKKAGRTASEGLIDSYPYGQDWDDA